MTKSKMAHPLHLKQWAVWHCPMNCWVLLERWPKERKLSVANSTCTTIKTEWHPVYMYKPRAPTAVCKG